MDKEFIEKYLEHMATIQVLIEEYKENNLFGKEQQVNLLTLFLFVIINTDKEIDEDDLIEIIKLSMKQLDNVQDLMNKLN